MKVAGLRKKSKTYPDSKSILNQLLDASQAAKTLQRAQQHPVGCSYSISSWRSTEPRVLVTASYKLSGFTTSEGLLVKVRMPRRWGRASISNANFWSRALLCALLDSKVTRSTKFLHMYCLNVHVAFVSWQRLISTVSSKYYELNGSKIWLWFSRGQRYLCPLFVSLWHCIFFFFQRNKTLTSFPSSRQQSWTLASVTSRVACCSAHFPYEEWEPRCVCTCVSFERRWRRDAKGRAGF